MLKKNIVDYFGKNRHHWLVTGCAGFIGSHLVEFLLKHNQIVIGLDNFSTGFQHNLDAVNSCLTETQRSSFKFIKGDIRDLETCRLAVSGVEYVLHQAALGSVPRSIEKPVDTNDSNVGGFVNILTASKDEKVKNFVFASSSSVYGDNADKIKTEDRIGIQLSPYALSKRINELYAENFSRVYGQQCTALRYFNVFGPRQNPGGAYAAVIPRWIEKIIKGENCVIYGDGATSRDFTYIDNVVAANTGMALMNELPASGSSNSRLYDVFNVACGSTTSLLQLSELIKSAFAAKKDPRFAERVKFNHEPERKGDIKSSLADISKIKARIGFTTEVGVNEGITKTVDSFL